MIFTWKIKNNKTNKWSDLNEKNINYYYVNIIVNS